LSHSEESDDDEEPQKQQQEAAEPVEVERRMSLDSETRMMKNAQLYK
jgi:hypothetical protein